MVGEQQSGPTQFGHCRGKLREQRRFIEVRWRTATAVKYLRQGRGTQPVTAAGQIDKQQHARLRAAAAAAESA